MDIVFILGRRTEVEHLADIRNVETARRNIRRHQQFQRTVAEALQRLGAHGLGQVAVDRRGVMAMLGQRGGHHIDFDLAVAEHDAVLHVAGFDHAAQRRAAGLAIVRGQMNHMLCDRLRRIGRTRHFDLLGIFLERLRKALDVGREGCGEQQRLAAGRQLGADLLDVRDEAHVEHPVGLVDDQRLDAHQQHLAAVELVHQAARRRDQHVDAALQQRFLVLEADAADQQRHRQFEVLAILLEVLGNLRGKLARRAEDQAARHARPGPAGGEALDHRQHEGSGLAGAGLGNAGHVAAHQDVRNGFALDGGGSRIAGFKNGFEDVFGEAEVRECGLSQG